MNSDEKKRLLEVEKSKGEHYSRVWEGIVRPFFESKEEALIEAFRNASSEDTNVLLRLRMQFNAIESLKLEFMHYIETGRMAQQQLFEEE